MIRGLVDIEVIRVSIFFRDWVRMVIFMLMLVLYIENRVKCIKVEWIKSGYMNNVFNYYMRGRKRDKKEKMKVKI